MQNNHLHAFASPPFWQWFDELIQEGNVYEFIDFTTVEANGHFRPVSSPVKILFTHETTSHVIMQPPVFIPMHKFELKTVTKLHNYVRASDPEDTPTFAPGY